MSSEVPTGDFELLDRFVALVLDIDFDGDGFSVEVELWSKMRKQTVKNTRSRDKSFGEFLQQRKLLLYIFVHRSFYVDRLVGHHEAFAKIGLGPGAHLTRGVLDFTNDEASSVPVRQNKAKVRRGDDDGEKTREPFKNKASSLLLNLLIRVTLFHGQESFDLKVHPTRLE